MVLRYNKSSLTADVSDMDRLTTQFLVSRRVRGCTASTVAMYTQIMAVLADLAQGQFDTVDRHDIERYLADALDSGLSSATVRNYLSVWRAFFNWLVEADLCSQNPTRHIRIKDRTTPPDTLTTQEIERVMRVWPRGFIGDRNRLVVLLGYDAMLRRQEIVDLAVRDIDIPGKTLLVRRSKSGRPRTVAYSQRTAMATLHYITRYHPAPYLITSKSGRRLAGGSVWAVLKRAAAKCGLSLHPHQLRHSGATEFIRRGGSIEILRRNLGHASLTTTQVYLHNSIDDQRDWADRCCPLS